MISLLAFAAQTRLARLSPIDLAIVIFYFLLVLGIGWYLKARSKTGEDFFMAGREMTAWIAGLSFMSANLGALELMGWSAAAYEYGILAVNAYWIAAVPAMLFLGIVMIPFYYISKTHSVPGYLKLRYDEPTRAVSAISFAFMTVLMSGINMYAMALLLNIVLGWSMSLSIWVSALTVACYVALGGLRSAIFNEVLQFVLIWGGALLIPVIGLVEAGGWEQLKLQIIHNTSLQYVHLWRYVGSFHNPMGVNWVGVILGDGFVISFAYWTTDFLEVQRVLAAKDLRAAKMAPIIGAAFKMFVPFIVVLPGLMGLVFLPHLTGASLAAGGAKSYNAVLPLMMLRYFGPGLLGLGVTALIAGFMSGMAGNVSAFATVWTYDIYRPLIKKAASDSHYVLVGRWSTIIGVLVSVGTAYVTMQFLSIMDYVQGLFSIFVAPLFGTVILGMLWKRTTSKGGFWGLLAGTISAASMFLWEKFSPSAVRYLALSKDAKPLAADFMLAVWAWLICVVVTVVVSLATQPKPVEQLEGLVYGATEIPKEENVPWIHKPAFWATVVAIVFIALNIIFW